MEWGAREFYQFFQEVHGGREPFPWQRRLAERVLQEGWPETIVLPTAFGKTAAVDIAVFALAAEASKPVQERRTPRRIFYAVDRRVIVDQAYNRAKTLEGALASALRNGSGFLHEVAKRLTNLGGEKPLQVLRLRGGIYPDMDWFSPAQPLVCATTVDQFGSRLLFRGYGVRDTALSVHAGLFGNDCLVILDEVHLSQPLWETLKAIRGLRLRAERPILSPWVIVRMSATVQDDGGGGTWGSDELNKEDNLEHEVLGPRAKARKFARLLEASNEEDFLGKVAEKARELCDDGLGSVVGVILNRVDYARAVFEKIQGGVDAILLTGRARPWDRDELLKEYGPRILAEERAKARRESPQGAPPKPLVVVATQCVEVGADLDFDAIVTQSASLDALRQRFGRQDRFGSHGDSYGYIIHLTSKEDPVYGMALKNTWEWLQEIAKKQRGKPREVDFGVISMGDEIQNIPPEELPRFLAPSERAPLFLSHHLDALAQTCPRPNAEPSVHFFLHGWGKEGAPEVQVVWRADLLEGQEEKWAEIVSLHPPTVEEAMPVPLYAVARWLRQAPEALVVADVEGVALVSDDQNRGRAALRWPNRDEAETIRAEGLRPGDTIIVPSSYGGADEYGWNPGARAPVEDIGDEVSWSRGRAVLRLRRDATRWIPESHPLRPQLCAVAAQDDLDEDQEPLREFLQKVSAAADLPLWARRAAKFLLGDPDFRLLRYPDGEGWVIRASRRVRGNAELDEDDRTTQTYAGRRVELQQHSEGVAREARRLASACGLDDKLAGDLKLAGWLHDIGKGDPRFQAWLYETEEWAVRGRPLLAKSGIDPNDWKRLEEARERAGYPKGERHEAMSLELVARASSVTQKAADPDLVLYLIASHHGRARPFFEPVDNAQDLQVSVPFEVADFGSIEFRGNARHGMELLDSGVVDRFWMLTRRYGWYGLAYLEAILRLADWLESEVEQRNEADRRERP